MSSMEDFIKEKSSGLGESDFSWVLRNSIWIIGKLVGPLRKFTHHVRMFLSMLGDYQSGKYRKAPFWTICVIAFALLYILMPFDAVPDFIPFAGLIDDALVVAAVLTMIDKDVKAYEKWRAEENKAP